MLIPCPAPTPFHRPFVHVLTLRVRTRTASALVHSADCSDEWTDTLPSAAALQDAFCRVILFAAESFFFLAEDCYLLPFFARKPNSFLSLRHLQATGHACTPGEANNARRTAVPTPWHMISFASTTHARWTGLPSKKKRLCLQATQQGKGSGRTQ